MTEAEALEVKGIRPTPQGKFEVTINHPSLDKGRVTRNFDSRVDAANYKVRRLAELNDGVVLPELKKTVVVGSEQLSVVLRHYLNSDTAKIAKTDRPNVELLQATLTGTVAGVTSTWTDDWVRKMKREQQLAPGSIRKKVESLARALDWWYRREYQDGTQPANPLRLLPRGYSAYHDDDVKPGQERPEDTKRDRRLHRGEYEKIVDIINGEKRPDRERAWGGDDRPDVLMLFRLIVATGMRLREAYRLRTANIRFDLRTIHIPRSKTGVARDVPMTRQVEAWLAEYHPTLGAMRDAWLAEGPLKVGSHKESVFPWWNGSDDEDVLAALSNKLSKRFKSLFVYAGADDLTEHDLRHEATCRWMEMKDKSGRWLYRPEEVRRITGHKNVQMFERYLSLRGSDLADRLD